MHDWLGLLRSTTDRFATVVATGDPDAPVTHCPGWRLRDLADHLGGVHQWAAHAVVAGTPDLEPEPAGALEAEPLADWYRGHADRLIQVLAERPEDRPAWAMDPSNRTAGFWRRRQVHETRLHLWDAELAVGEPTPIDPPLAWDGVLEVVDVVYPRQVRLDRIPPWRAGSSWSRRTDRGAAVSGRVSRSRCGRAPRHCCACSGIAPTRTPRASTHGPVSCSPPRSHRDAGPASAYAGWVSRSRWLITAETPSPRIVTP